ncbi:hypothetical protein LJR230_000016 [Trinickia sp. LjRoot230]|uniref:hypothetical protein n=1 Tax=Trinickia sp. LjRoot230 TaxID=3342288 RepID=UPI003ECD921E
MSAELERASADRAPDQLLTSATSVTSKPRLNISPSANARTNTAGSSTATLQAWVEEVLGPTYDVHEYHAELRKHADRSPAERGAAINEWLRRRALRVHPSEHPVFAALRPEFVNAGAVFNAVYRLPGHPLMAKVDMLQPRVLAGYNRQFAGRELSYEPDCLAEMADDGLRQERSNLREMRRFFGPRIPREFLRRMTVPVPGRTLKLLAQEELGHQEPIVDGENAIYSPMAIDSNRVYPFDLTVRFQEDLSELYGRLARGEDAISFRGHYVEDPSHSLPDIEQYKLVSDLWVANRYPGRKFGPEERMLFEKIHGLSGQQDTLNRLLMHADDPDLQREVRDFVSAAIHFSNTTRMTLDTIGDGNVFFAKIDGKWQCVMADAQVPRLEPMLKTFSGSLNLIANNKLPDSNAGWHLMVGLPYIQSVNAVAHFLGLTERIQIPGGVPEQMPWGRLLSLIVSRRQPAAPHAVFPLFDRPLWRRPPSMW